MKLSDYNYNLPENLIAQKPTEPRDHSRLLVLSKDSGEIEHKHFYDIVEYLHPGDVLVLNNSKVFPARLMGKKANSGGKVEVFLLKNISGKMWECLLGGRVHEGLEIEFAERLKAQAIKNNQDGTWEVEFNHEPKELLAIAENIGSVPLPPYIKRDEEEKDDKARYQTVYADKDKVGSVAAPTAGLHFTDELIEKIKKMGVEILEVTLHVGMGTFAPVKTENVLEHKMHAEWLEIDSETIKKIVEAKKDKKRIIAVGTTSCRSLETLGKYLTEDFDTNKDFKCWTDIFIYPPYQFKIVDALITNFHLPQSTLLMLISALAGKENVDKAYEIAIKQGYGFFSYGDAMFIV
ncbi:MAG: tRNA preQ1(34) S-adenosylmethionine ribosyltransferase-isomerase QueA [Candidatus Falkowbacteria bacterium]